MKMVFTREQQIFVIESYFRNGYQAENGAWVYQIESTFQEFAENFPNVVLCEHFSETLKYLHRSQISRKWQCSAEALRFVLRKILRLSNVE
jgi:hypothetical protein